VSTGFLTSFHYYRKHDLAELAGALRGFPLFADSGAYSAFSIGAPVQLADYAQWLARWKGLFTVYANLDVMGDAEATWRNQIELERLGFHPIPVFHYGDPWEYLARYLERGDPYIALGGMVGAPAPVKRWAVRCFRLAGDKAVFHGFGRTNLPELRDFPWYSVDSSSWGMGYRYGVVNLFDNGKWVKISVGDHAGVYKYAHLVRAHGVDPKYIADRKLYHWKFACQISAVAWHRLGIWVHKRHAPIAIPRRDATREPGPHLYLADTATGVNLRLPVGAQAIRDDGGPHLYLADGSDRMLTMGAAAIREQPGPHLYLADAASASDERVTIAARVIRELEERA
jgi:hypothetical protein